MKMKKPSHGRPSLAKEQEPVHKYTVDATVSTDRSLLNLPESTLRALLDESVKSSYGSIWLSGECVMAALEAAERNPGSNGGRYDLPRLRGLMRTIGPRLAFKAGLRQVKTSSDYNPESAIDNSWTRDFELVETRAVLDTVAQCLEKRGVQRANSVAVILHLLGWCIKDIAQAQNLGPETVKKRISRAKPSVIIELRHQFAQEVA